MWGDENSDDESTDSDNDDSGRLYDFVVAKTNDQEENVVARSGFKVHYFLERFLGNDLAFSRLKMDTPLLVYGQPPPRIHIDQNELSPRLLYGETMQGFMTAEFKQAKTLVDKFLHHDQSAAQIRLLV